MVYSNGIKNSYFKVTEILLSSIQTKYISHRNHFKQSKSRVVIAVIISLLINNSL